MINESKQRLKYVLGDYVMSNLGWAACNVARFYLGNPHREFGSLASVLTSQTVVMGQVLFPLMMMVVYYLSGYYNEVFRKSRLQEIFTSLWSAGINALVIFFVALINDRGRGRQVDYEIILVIWFVLFAAIYSWRCIVTSYTSHMIKTRRWSFSTLIVGRGAAAVAYANKLDSMPQSLGYRLKGFVSIPGENDVKEVTLPCYSLDEIARVCADEKIEELIVVPTKQSTEVVLNTINRLFALNLPIKVTPDRINVLLSQVRISDLHGDPLVDISGSNLSDSGKNLKRLIDVMVSALVLIVLSPLLLVVALLVKLDSKGPVIYTQERVGFHNKPFKMYKFRTMVHSAEQAGVPQLTCDNDPRITRLGKSLRKYRIDELPQFWNVLKGDMSIVGPRPERQYFINQIQERVPSYALVHQVRPGITSMGMVKYGYAQDVDQMLERLSYDLIYLENMSLINDFKIMVYTIKTVITGKGM